MDKTDKRPLPGSERHPLAGARHLGPADPQERFSVSVILRPSNQAALRERLARVAAGDRSLPPLSREAVAASHGASHADIEAVRQFAAAHHLAVTAADPARRTVTLAGTAHQFEAAFAVRLHRYAHSAGNYRGCEGAVHLPPELLDCVQAVLGLDNRPQAKTHFRLAPPGKAVRPAEAGVGSFTPVTLGELYDFPTGTGAGETIAFIELGGGTHQADLAAYFHGLGLAPPKLVSIPVDGGSNAPTGSPDGPDGEVMLDLEVAGAIAPAATLAVYFAPNTDAGFLDAITTAIHDSTNKPSIISISWGGPESSWSQQSFTAFDQAFQDAVALGITVCVAAGDNGSSDNASGDNVDFPASSPHVLACGGTSLLAQNQRISSETVWNDGAGGGATGGGISTAFTTVPAWQQGLRAALTAGGSSALTGRAVPDVAGDADPQTGYQVRVDGSNTVIGGTSAVAPLWAGLIARLNAKRGAPAGFINPLLYANPQACNDITSGNNGSFAAATGWDACTGLGSPKGSALAALLESEAPGSAPIA